jgi:two-component system response regulator MprA
MRLLLVEDDTMIGEVVLDLLRAEHYAVDWVKDGDMADTALQTQTYDLVLLDLGLPRKDGLEVLRSRRARKELTPVLVATARDAKEQRIAGLDAGADDYVVKPFDVEEVFARLRALLRRTTPLVGTGGTAADQARGPHLPERQIEAAGLRMDLQARRAWRGKRELELTRTEFELLELLVRNAGIVLDHSTIYDRIWGYDFGPGSKNLAVYVGYLRRKLDEPGAPQLIHTVRGVGYVLRED